MAKCVKKLHFYKLIFAYDGSRFAGSAKQPGGGTVQDALDAALRRLGAVSLPSCERFLSVRGGTGEAETGDGGIYGGAAECGGIAAGAAGAQIEDGAQDLSGRIGFSGASGGVSDNTAASAKAPARASKNITLFASRTDRGVHALTNVAKAAFGYELDIAYAAGKINAECPGIWLRSIAPCAADFQPRFGARGRSYRYVFRLQNSAVRQVFSSVPERVNLCNLSDLELSKMAVVEAANTRPRAGVLSREFGAKTAAFYKQYAATLPREFCLASFTVAARELLGEHDFCQLCLNAAEHASTRRRVQAVRLYRSGDLLVFNIFSTGFLRGQIRLIIGALLAVAAGKITHEQWLEQLSGARAHVRLSAPAAGLYLKSIYY